MPCTFVKQPHVTVHKMSLRKCSTCTSGEMSFNKGGSSLHSPSLWVEKPTELWPGEHVLIHEIADFFFLITKGQRISSLVKLDQTEHHQ